MIINVEFGHVQEYLPTKRHRKLRKRRIIGTMNVDIREPKEEEFPVAFVIHDYASIYENAMSPKDFDGNGDFKLFANEIRVYNGELYTPKRITWGSAISSYFEPVSSLRKILATDTWIHDVEHFSEDSIIVNDDIENCKTQILKRAEEYIVFQDKIWTVCTEPLYHVQTFGLGHNHGGTSLFIDYFPHGDEIPDNYFTALERDKAISFGKKIALNRGDTESVERLENRWIDVLMPEMVTKRPVKMKTLLLRLVFPYDDFNESLVGYLTLPENIESEDFLFTLQADHEYLCDRNNESNLYDEKGRTPKTLISYACKKHGWTWEIKKETVDMEITLY